MNQPYLTNHFLIAMPNLADPNFSHTVTYICEHNADGAMGITINRPLGIHLEEIFTEMKIEVSDEMVKDRPVYLGGPVQQELGFVLHQPSKEWEATMGISSEIALTTSRDILKALADGKGPACNLVALGYAGWAAGQLEQEMADNVWLSGPAAGEIVFNLPAAERWEAAASHLGVDLSRLSGDVGHA